MCDLLDYWWRLVGRYVYIKLFCHLVFSILYNTFSEVFVAVDDDIIFIDYFTWCSKCITMSSQVLEPSKLHIVVSKDPSFFIHAFSLSNNMDIRECLMIFISFVFIFICSCAEEMILARMGEKLRNLFDLVV